MDISELTWEQKETVLRMLFAKMNHAARQPKLPCPYPPLPPALPPPTTSGEVVMAIEGKEGAEEGQMREGAGQREVFLTQHSGTSLHKSSNTVVIATQVT